MLLTSFFHLGYSYMCRPLGSPLDPDRTIWKARAKSLPATFAVPVAQLNKSKPSSGPAINLWPSRTCTHPSQGRWLQEVPGAWSEAGRGAHWAYTRGAMESWGYLSGFCVHTCICKRIRCVKVLKHCPHFQRCQSLNSEWSWLVEVGLARTRWFFTLIWLNPDSMGPDLSRREKFLLHGVWGKTTERCWAAGGSLLLLLKGCNASCLHMASMTVEGTFTGGTRRAPEGQFC